MTKYDKMINTTYGRLLIRDIVGYTKDKSGRARLVVSCECSCGNVVEKIADNILAGYTKSCGCLKKESSVKTLMEYKSLGQPPWNKRADDEAVVIRMLQHYRSGAKRRGYSFDLTEEDFKQLIQKPCHYCGSPPNGGYSKGDFLVNGIDRVNNSLGYTLDNSVPCCSLCNSMKSTLPVDVFTSHVEKISNFLRNPNGNN
jgi:hypothetical protein